MLDKEALLKQLKHDISKLDGINESKKVFYTILYNIVKREIKNDITIYNSDFKLD